ncbi:MAG: hypothetical protein VCD00_11560 [Candidatus Hydrogenedentota bacterium]
MNAIVLFTALCLSQFSIQVSPDRIHPFSYTDEPLAIRITGLARGDHAIEATIEAHELEATKVSLGTVHSDGAAPCYVTVDTSALPMGRLSVTIMTEEGTLRDKLTAYRIHRPSYLHARSITASFIPWSPEAYELASELPYGWARISTQDGNFDEAMAVLQNRGIGVRLLLDNTTEKALEGIARRHGDQITHWEIPVMNDIPSALSIAAQIEDFAPGRSISVHVANPLELTECLESEGSATLDEIIVSHSEVDEGGLHSYRLVIEQSGFEFLDLVTEMPRDTTTSDWSAWSNNLASFSPSRITLGLSGSDADETLTSISRYNLWSDLFSSYEYVGPQFSDPELEVLLFRSRTDRASWLMAATASTPTSWAIPMQFGEVHAMSADTNIFSIDNTRELSVGSDPVFLTGRDKEVLTDSLSNAILLEVSTLLAVETYKDVVSDELWGSLKRLKNGVESSSSRSIFLELLLRLPVLEHGLASGSMPIHLVVPVTVRLTRITRWMSAIAELQDEAFLEPHETMLTQTNRFIARFMSGRSEVPESSRPAQLIQAISRLSTEATELNARGYPIEAAGVAMIAEWRARALAKHTDTSN